jgi:exodeoxyribonuclease V alpha subunit
VEVLAGTVKELLTVRPEDGRLVMRVSPAGAGSRTETVVAPRTRLAPGVRTVFRGRWNSDHHLGRYFLAEQVELGLPTERSEIIRFLTSGLFRGIGHRRAELLADRFGAALWDTLRADPARLKAAGIGPGTVEALRSALAETEAAWATVQRLQAVGADPVLARTLLEALGPEAPVRLDRDPYSLVGLVPGFGFELAERLGRRRADLARSRRAAWVVHLLQRAADEDGHCYLPLSELLRRLDRRLKSEALVEAVREGIASGRIRYEAVGGGRLYLTALHDAEETTARALAARLAGIEPVRADGWLAALELLTAAPVAVLTGGPGVGKTRLIAELLGRPALRGRRVVLAAPTGRAARRLEAAARRPAFTVHRLLEYQPETGRFRRGAESPLEADLVVVDEVSMLDLPLAERLAGALGPGARLVLVGDPAQIPSVGPGNLLGDLLASGVVPVARLTEVQRQAADSAIIFNAYRVLAGQVPAAEAAPDFGVLEASSAADAVELAAGLVMERIPALVGLNPGHGVQVLAAKYAGPAGVDRLNERLQALVNPLRPGMREVVWKGRRFRPGDRVVQQVNAYARGVANGETGRVLRVDPDGPELQVQFETAFGPWTVTYRGAEIDQLDLAYALTIHKSQGSDYPAVVIVAARDHLPMLDRQLLYTAITRARRWCFIVTQSGVLPEVVRAEQTRRRYTTLAERLRGYCGNRPVPDSTGHVAGD